MRSALRNAAHAPASLNDDELITLLGATGPDLAALCATADELRSVTVGNDVTFVINRNLNASLFTREHGAEELTAAPTHGPDLRTKLLNARMIGDLAAEAAALGATEVCIQGVMRPELSGNAYLEVVAAVHSREPGLHIHAYGPAEILDGASRLGISPAEFLEALKEAGVGSIPGTGARILNDRLRAVLSASTDPPVSEWLEIITAAHRTGLTSTATMVFGHIESAAEQVAHLRQLAAIQDQTGGFTEFIAMPFVPHLASSTVRALARPGPDIRETRAVYAVARLILNGRIDNLQVAWTKVGLRTGALLLQGGANDFGGLLLDGVLWPEAGAEAHRELRAADIRNIATDIGRTVRQRTTSYGSLS